MSDLLQGYGKARKIISPLIQIGISSKETLTMALKDFFNMLDDFKYEDNISELRKVKNSLKGKKLTENDLKRIKRKEQSATTYLSVFDKKSQEAWHFQRLCMDYGISFHLAQRPDNLNELFSRYINNEVLSEDETKLIKAFIDIDGDEVKLKEDNAVLSFFEKDINKMEAVVEQMEKYTLNIKKRKELAKKTKDRVEHIKIKLNKEIGKKNYHHEH